MAEQVYSGNQASDYQPPTRNPQDNAVTNLQPNQAVLQPVTAGQINQQVLPTVGNLQVINNGTKQEAIANHTNSHDAPIVQIGFLAILILLVAIVVYKNKFNSRPKSSKVSGSETPPESLEIEKAQSTKKKHSPRPTKKRRNRSAKKYR